jgi:hypothetical protein
MELRDDLIFYQQITGEDEELTEQDFLEPVINTITYIGMYCRYPQCQWFSGYLDEGATIDGEEITDVFNREYLEHCKDVHC